MANTYYDSQLTAAEIEAVLEAINGILNPANNGKVLAINSGKLEARSVQWSSSAVIEPLSVTQNGTYNPPSGVDGYAPVTVIVSGGGSNYTDILNFEQGSVTTTTSGQTDRDYPTMKSSSNTRIRSQALFPMIVGATYALSFNDDVYDVCLQPFNWKAGSWGSQPDANVYNVWKGSFSFTGRGGYIAIVFRRKNEANITPSEISDIDFSISISK